MLVELFLERWLKIQGVEGIWREANLDRAEEAWIAFTYRRDDLERGKDDVSFDVSPDGGQTWYMLDRFKGDADDFGERRGKY